MKQNDDDWHTRFEAVRRYCLILLVSYVIGMIGGTMLWLTGAPHTLETGLIIAGTLLAGVLTSRWIAGGGE